MCCIRKVFKTHLFSKNIKIFQYFLSLTEALSMLSFVYIYVNNRMKIKDRALRFTRNRFR